MGLEYLTGILFILFFVSIRLNAIKLYFKFLLVLFSITVLIFYSYLLHDLSDEVNSSTYFNDLHEWTFYDSSLEYIDNRYVFISGDLSTNTLSNPDFDIKTQGQLLIKKTQIRKEVSYDCGYEATCYKLAWRTTSTNTTALKEYRLQGAALDESIIQTIKEYFPQEAVPIDNPPTAYEYKGRTFFSAFEDGEVVYRSELNKKQIGDIKIMFSKANLSSVTMIGEVLDGKLKMTSSFDIPFLLMEKTSLAEYKALHDKEDKNVLILATIVLLILMYTLFGGIYLVFGLADKILKSRKGKLLFFVFPAVVTLLIYMFLA